MAKKLFIILGLIATTTLCANAASLDGTIYTDDIGRMHFMGKGNYSGVRTMQNYVKSFSKARNNFADYNRCLDLHYKNNIGDEFVNPSIITKGSNIKDNDGVLFIDFRQI